MIRGIHYFSTELKTNLMSSQGAALRERLVVSKKIKMVYTDYCLLFSNVIINTI